MRGNKFKVGDLLSAATMQCTVQFFKKKTWKNVHFTFAIILVLIPFLSFCQNEKSNQLTDTSMAVGIIAEDCYVGKTIGSMCIVGVDKHLNKGTSVLISGIRDCKEEYLNKFTQFFEIMINNQSYFIEKDKLLTYDGYYEQLEKMPVHDANLFRANAQIISEQLFKSDEKKAISFLKNCTVKGLAILDWNIYDESEYTEGTSVNLKVYNPTSKTIKYIWFTLVGINPVGDKVIDRRKGTSNITVKAVGPIKEEESASYQFSYVWFTDLVETGKISSIKVQYMDNSIKTITNPKEIILPQKLFNTVFNDE